MNFINDIRCYVAEVSALLDAGSQVSVSSSLIAVSDLFEDDENPISVVKNKQTACKVYSKLLGRNLSAVRFCDVTPKYGNKQANKFFVQNLDRTLFLGIEEGGTEICIFSTRMFSD